LGPECALRSRPPTPYNSLFIASEDTWGQSDGATNDNSPPAHADAPSAVDSSLKTIAGDLLAPPSEYGDQAKTSSSQVPSPSRTSTRLPLYEDRGKTRPPHTPSTAITQYKRYKYRR